MLNQSPYNTHVRSLPMRIKFLALAISIALLSTFIAPVFATHMGGHPKLKTTQLTVDPLPECTNAFQCNATFLSGDIVTFTGILTDDTGRFVRDAKINIYSFTATEMQLLASAVTERDGTFKTTWKAQFMGTKFGGETFKQQINEVLTIFAKFEGDNKYAPSQSGRIVITVKIKDMITVAATDKKLYKEGEAALVFANFIEAEIEGKNIEYGNFIDPDSMRATYDGEPVELSKKKSGSYTFVTPPLTVGHHQLVINPAKEGYNNRVGFITVQVSGFFGK